MKKYLNSLISIIKCLFFIFIGILYIIDNNKIFTYSFLILGIAILVLNLIKIYHLITKKELITIKIIDIITNFIFAILLITNKNLFITIFTKILGTYILIQSICGIINLYIYKIDQLKGKFFVFTTTFISFIISILLLIKNKDADYLSLIIGIFLIIYGISLILSTIEKRKIIVHYPTLLTMFIPRILIKKITKDTNIKEINNQNSCDLEILIHLAKDGTASLGHVEISFQNKIYSYSCYNYQNRKLFGGMGDGILGIFDHDAYLKYNVIEKDRFIISYGLKLNKDQITKIKNKLIKFTNENTIKWYPEVAFNKQKEYHEIANQLYLKTDAKFYKFAKGEYQTFFVFRNNCVKFVDDIISTLNTKTINFYGLISPGTYYSFLEKEFKEKKSIIISKNIYTKDYVQKLNYQYKNKKN